MSEVESIIPFRDGASFRVWRGKEHTDIINHSGETLKLVFKQTSEEIVLVIDRFGLG